MKTIKNSKANLIGFFVYIFIVALYVAYLFYQDIDKGKNFSDMITYGLFFFTGGILLYFDLCTGELLYDETHLEYHIFTGRAKFSISYMELLEIDYHKYSTGKNSWHKYIFTLANGKIYKMKDLVEPKELTDLVTAIKKQNPDIKIYKSSNSLFSERREDFFT